MQEPGPLRLQLALPPGTAAPAWLQAALAGLQRQQRAQLLLVADAAHVVLHVGASTTLQAAADAGALHWALADGAGRWLQPRWPLLEDITTGRGMALGCWQLGGAGDIDGAGRAWHLRRSLHVAASPRYASGMAGLAPAVERLLGLALTALRLDTPLPAASLPALGAAADVGTATATLQQATGLLRAAVRRVRALALSETWRIGVIDVPVDALLQAGPLPPVRWLTGGNGSENDSNNDSPSDPNSDHDGYWADPFGLPGDPHRLACEFFDRRSGRGRIETLTLGAVGQPPLRQPQAVGGAGHASFPHVCSIDGQRLGVAETLATRQCVLHAVDDGGHWRPLWPLLQGVAAADPALFSWQGRYWLAYTDTALGTQDNLCLQHADSLRGPWLPHAANPVKVDVASARMAGSLFQHGGALFRPGQDCLGGYGAAVVLHRIDVLTPTQFEETAVRRVTPDPAGPCPHGLHTVSGWDGRTLVDGKRLALQPAALLQKWRKLRQRGRIVPGAVFVYVPHLRTGGGELSMLELAAGFADAGRAVTLVVHTARTQELALPPGVQLLSLGREGTAGALWRLVAALHRHRPQWLLSAFPHSNVAAVAAVALARCGTRCVVSEHAPVSLQIAQHARADAGWRSGWRYRVLPPLLRWAYPHAAAVVAVSEGVRSDLQTLAPHAAPVVIRNPVLPPTLQAELAQPPDHPWLLDPALRVVLSVCRLAEEKDLPTLLQAFATLHRTQPATRLLLAGEGPERARLQALVATLGLQQVVQLPGRTTQPLRWMQRAAVLVLASRFEGFGNVLVEALACGTPVVATDCPVGPREILRDGRFGALVPVGDAAAMASAITQTLQQRTLPPGAREAALQYTRERAAAAYLALFDRLAASTQNTGAAAC